jgi:trk/ktr system potassium uptake protein
MSVSLPPTSRGGDAFGLAPILHLIGWFVGVLGALMLVPAIVDRFVGNSDWQVFAVSSAGTLFIGAATVMSTERPHGRLSIHQGFLLTAGVWMAAAGVGAVPLWFSQFGLDFTDAVFESMSGITTTGSTTIVGLDTAPPGILLWRGLLQWIGGIGFIVVGLAMLPFLKIGGMQLFRLESSEKSEKAMPQATRFAAAFVAIYVGLTMTCALLLKIAGMTTLEAVAHAMSTIATGGFSTSDSSVGHFANPVIDWIIVVFMISGSLPFLLYVRLLQRRRKLEFSFHQVVTFFRLIGGATLLMTLWLVIERDTGLFEALTLSAFNVVSIVTTTGFATDDYSLWGHLPLVLFMLLTFVGGCSGATAGGIKMFRFDMLLLALELYVRRLIYPHGAFVVTYDGRRVGEDVIAGVLMFVGIYLITTGAVSVVLAILGLDFMTSISGAATAIGNVGPGLGPLIGPAGNFAEVSDAAKWVLTAAMLLGRLELFTVFALFAPAFWRP